MESLHQYLETQQNNFIQIMTFRYGLVLFNISNGYTEEINRGATHQSNDMITRNNLQKQVT